MIWISHRGNLDGPIPSKENTPEYINEALSYGFNVEIDVWFIDGELYLGHDKGTIDVPPEYLRNERIWFHCKNVNALNYMVHNYRNLKFFWHQEDDYTLTSTGHIWTYPGKLLMKGSIAVLPEVKRNGDLWKCYAICTDYLWKYYWNYQTSTTISTTSTAI